VEALVDRIGSERHELSGAAKDLGSAAVFLALMLVVVVWSLILIPRFLS
jgi:diacylglycerol kinase (ATP)